MKPPLLFRQAGLEELGRKTVKNPSEVEQKYVM